MRPTTQKIWISSPASLGDRHPSWWELRLALENFPPSYWSYLLVVHILPFDLKTIQSLSRYSCVSILVRISAIDHWFTLFNAIVLSWNHCNTSGYISTSNRTEKIDSKRPLTSLIFSSLLTGELVAYIILSKGDHFQTNTPSIFTFKRLFDALTS